MVNAEPEVVEYHCRSDFVMRVTLEVQSTGWEGEDETIKGAVGKARVLAEKAMRNLRIPGTDHLAVTDLTIMGEHQIIHTVDPWELVEVRP